jgi:hypothetical protein
VKRTGRSRPGFRPKRVSVKGDARFEETPFAHLSRRLIMALAAEKELEHIGESCGCADHDHDLIHDLSKRLDALWRYDQYIANAEGKPVLQALWSDLKRQELENIHRVKQIIAQEIRQNDF